MPFAFIIVGTMLVVSGVKGTSNDLFALVKGDFTGQHTFIYWAMSILILGSLGYIDELRPLSRAFLVLVLVVLILANGGFFQLFNQAISSTQSQSSQLPSTSSTTLASSISF